MRTWKARFHLSYPQAREELTPGFAGNKLGAIRDNKGKPVAQVFATLPVSQKAEILRALAFKVLGSMA